MKVLIYGYSRKKYREYYPVKRSDSLRNIWNQKRKLSSVGNFSVSIYEDIEYNEFLNVKVKRG
ncbi:hypothetical protein EAY39_20315 [Vibrio anguillarum]|nr:hypothetical protein CMV05_22475 [Vibrio anguillarum]MBF4343056.1 hypothetical protein [Vibrio anguillarum]MBF4371212.1 hypothetical protein [Vibrio anguillarum]